MALYSTLERNELPSYEKTWRNLKCIISNELNGAHLKRLHTVCVPYMTFWKRQNYGEGKKVNGCQGSGKGKDE